MSLPYIQIDMPASKKNQIIQTAAREGITAKALCRRIVFLYLSDPLAFHKILFDNETKPAPTAPGQSFY